MLKTRFSSLLQLLFICFIKKKIQIKYWFGRVKKRVNYAFSIGAKHKKFGMDIKVYIDGLTNGVTLAEPYIMVLWM